MANKKIYILSAAIVFILVLLAVFTYSYFRQLPPQSADLPPENKISAAHLQADLESYNKAVSGNNPDVCNQISDGFSQTLCLKEVAVNTGDAKTCSLIKDDLQKNDCLNNVSMQGATQSKDLAGCEKISDPMLARACVEAVSVQSGVDCSLLKNQDYKDSCLSLSIYQEARAGGDFSKCLSIPEPIRKANCLSEIGKIDLHSDADKDGLDFLQEIARGTDPDKKDTDKDGHNDGEELKAGFSPLGDGKIIRPLSPNSINCYDITKAELKAACFLEVKDPSFPYLDCAQIKDYELKNFCLKNSPR